MKTSRRGFLASLLALPFVGKSVGENSYLPMGYKCRLDIAFAHPTQMKFYEKDIVAAELERVHQHIPILFDNLNHFYEQIGTRRRKGRGRSQRGRRG